MNKLMPTILSFSLVIAVAAVWVAKLWLDPAWLAGLGGLGANCFVGLYLAWMIFEVRVALREEGQKYADFGTRELYGASHAATILVALWFARPGQGWPWLMLTGGLGFGAGVALRAWAIRTLGRFYSHSVRTVAEHRVVDTGPYRRLRHPAYSGMLLAHAGVVLAFFSLPALALYLLGLWPAVVLRLLVEERALAALPGYLDFSRTRKRLIPGLW
jgi:protein-S-isoprenylcysteine O-methyltransferase Ste14